MSVTRSSPVALALLLACADPAPPTLRLNELVAANQTGLRDADDQAEDWFEVFNPGDEEVALDGWSVGHSADARAALVSGLVVPARGHVVLFADDAAGSDHVALKLAVEGEALGLYAPGAVLVDHLAWGPLLPDLALARVPDGGADWVVTDEATPGAPNGGAASGAPAGSVVCDLDVAGKVRLTEGEVAALTASCAESGDRGFTWFGPRDEEDDESWSWSTGVADAGDHAVLVAVSDPAVAGVPVTAVTTLSVADAWSDPDNVPVDPATYTSEWGVPVLHLAVGSAIPEDYVPAEAVFDGTALSAQIKVRGAASAGFPKPSYTVEFDPIQLDLGPYGLSNKDHLVLVSNFDDNSHLRQRLVYDTWAAMAAFWGSQRLAPRTVPIVVYLDGRYQGLFLGLDHADDEFIREMGLESGGNLYKSVSHDANFLLTAASGYPKYTLHDGWEKKEGADLYDFSDLDALTWFVGSVSHDEFAAQVDDHLVTDEFMDWYHLVAALACDDSIGKNAYLYADPVRGRWRYVPWDFNASVGQSWTTARRPAQWLDSFAWYNGIFWHFEQHPALAEAHWERLRSMRAAGGPLSLGALRDRLDASHADIAGHPERDWARWEAEYHAYGLWSYRTDWTTPAEERAYLDSWLAERDAVFAAAGF